MSEFYIGLMSGTSLDGIDAGLIEFKNNQIHPLAFEYLPFTHATRKSIQNLTRSDSILLTEYGVIDTLLGALFAQACNNLLANTNISKSEIIAIGCHGQTIYHLSDTAAAFSLQIGDPNIVAEKTGITTVADFRRRDIAVGGKGAPLAPAFHQAFFKQKFDLSQQNISIINIGGIANITYLSNTQAIGFDIGPGNALIDCWSQTHLDAAYDKGGAWARKGLVNAELVEYLKQDKYFSLVPPKSTGKEYFSPAWLNKKLKHFPDCNANDIQASLCQLTAETIAEAMMQYATHSHQTLICGGGIHNEYLIELIQNGIAHPVDSTAKFGIDPDHVEAMAFAWLARQTINNLPGNLMGATGAKSPAILGGIYPSNKGF